MSNANTNTNALIKRTPGLRITRADNVAIHALASQLQKAVIAWERG